MQNRQNRAIARRIQKLARVPACCQRSSFCFAVTDNTTNDQIRIIERGPVSVRDRVTKFAAFVNRARSLRRDVTGNSSGKRELLEEALQAFFVLRDVRIDFAVGAFEICVRYEAGTAVSRSGDVNGIEIMLLDQAIQMYIDEVQSGCCAPVAKKPWLNVFQLQRFAQQGIRIEIDLADRNVVRRAPVRVDLTQFLWRKRLR